MTGKENVINAMRLGARLKIGGYANNNRLYFTDGSSEKVHGSTANAVLGTGLVKPLKLDPWSLMSTEWESFDSFFVLKGV
jgi:hypothetical protein